MPKILWKKIIQLAIRPSKIAKLVFYVKIIYQAHGFKGVRIWTMSKIFKDTHSLQLNDYSQWVKEWNDLLDRDREAITARVGELPYLPLISIIMPVYNTEPTLLKKTINSVKKQIYSNWELCIADDSSTNLATKRVLTKLQRSDSRIKVFFRQENGHISAASNDAWNLAKGEYVAFLDHDDLLAEHALYMVVEELNQYPDAKLIYSDEDKIDENDMRKDPYFKSDWNPLLMYGCNYINHFTVIDAKLVKEVGGFKLGVEGAQDYDLFLRVIEKIKPKNIRHIPFILYHWRAEVGSTALEPNAKPYVVEKALQVLNAHLQRVNVAATAKTSPDNPYRFRVCYHLPEQLPLVSIIIPTRDRVDLLRIAINGVLNKTDYTDIEIIIVDNGSTDPDTLSYFAEIRANQKVKILEYDAPFNYSQINNFAVKHAQGDILCLLNNDIEPIKSDWLREMVSYALRPEIGAVGAKLYYPNDTIQHAGVVLGMGGVADHIMKFNSRYDEGYFSRLHLQQNYSAVTAACMVLRKEVYQRVGGFDGHLAVAFNDVDLCIKIVKLGYWIAWTPYAELYHYESASRGAEDSPAKIERFKSEINYIQKKHGDFLNSDPFYNINFSLNRDMKLAKKPRVNLPWQMQRTEDRGQKTDFMSLTQQID